ncbi:MAG: ATP-binding protein [Actinomycetota bacterium]
MRDIDVQTLWVRSNPASAATVRHRMTASLAGLQVADDTIADVALVATELVSNSVRHAMALPDGGLSVDWDVTSDGVIVRVTDGGSSLRPTLQHAAPDAMGGRGLVIVNEISDRWGVEECEEHVTVWAHLPGRTDTA